MRLYSILLLLLWPKKILCGWSCLDGQLHNFLSQNIYSLLFDHWFSPIHLIWKFVSKVSKVRGSCFLTICLRMCHHFSIWFKSRDFDGHLNYYGPLCLRKCCVTFEVYWGPLSWANTHPFGKRKSLWGIKPSAIFLSLKAMKIWQKGVKIDLTK